MSVIRYGEQGFDAYIYIDASRKYHINISTPSYTGVVPLAEAVKIINLLIKLEEVPANILEQLYKEVQISLSSKRK